MSTAPPDLDAMRATAHAALILADDLSVAARSPLTASFACYEQCDDWTVDAGVADNVAVFSYGEGDARFFVGAVASVPAMAGHVVALAAEVERLQALLAPTRGDLLVAYASAGAARVEAWQRLCSIPEHHINHEPARLAHVAAVADEAAKRTALDAFERAHGLDLTHPGAAPTEEP